MDFIMGLLQGVLISFVSAFLLGLWGLWLAIHKTDGKWKVRARYLKGKADRRSHTVTLPNDFENRLLQSDSSGVIWGDLRAEKDWSPARMRGLAGRKRGFGLWSNGQGYWGWWTAYRLSDPEPRTPMKAGRPQQPPTPKR